jgi:integrase
MWPPAPHPDHQPDSDDPAGSPTHSTASLFGVLTGLGLDPDAAEGHRLTRLVQQGVRATAQAILHLIAAGVMGEGRCSIGDAERLAQAQIALRYGAVRSTEQKIGKEVGRFFRFLRANHVDWLDEITAEHVEEFLWSASHRHGRFSDVSPTTAANRQSILRTLFAILEDLGVGSRGDLIGSPIPRGDGEPCRRLTDAEMHQVHVHAYGGLLIGRLPLIVALTEAGGDPSEIATVQTDDVDVIAGLVHFSGDGARTNPLSSWALEAIISLFDNEHPRLNERLCASDDLPVERAAHSITVRLRSVLRDAGLAGLPGVTPRSIRLTAAQRVLDVRGLEAAARFLGNDSLDLTAKALDYDWWDR